jgi:hypothetical protein
LTGNRGAGEEAKQFGQDLRGAAAAVEGRRGAAPVSAIGFDSQSDRDERRARLGTLAFGPQPIIDGETIAL